MFHPPNSYSSFRPFSSPIKIGFQPPHFKSTLTSPIHFPSNYSFSAMGANNRQKKAHSSFSIFNLFKSKKGRKGDLYDHGGSSDEVPTTSKVWPSDEDRGYRWVAEPGIDRKAKDYIDRIYKNRVFETERQTVTINPNGPKFDV